MTHLHTNRADVPEIFLKAFPSYKGTKFDLKSINDGSMTLHSMQWSGGTRSEYVVLNLADGHCQAVTDSRPFPQNQYALPPLAVPSGFAVVEHSTFCGKDMGVTIYVHPEALAPLLPAPVDLPEDMVTVLAITAALKPVGRQDAARREGISPANWERCKAELIERKYLRKNGAITPEGRNVVNASGKRIW